MPHRPTSGLAQFPHQDQRPIPTTISRRYLRPVLRTVSHELSALSDDLRRMVVATGAAAGSAAGGVRLGANGLAVVDEQLRLLDLNRGSRENARTAQDEAAGSPGSASACGGSSRHRSLRAACEAGVAWLDDGVVFRQSDDTDFYVSLHFVPLISQRCPCGWCAVPGGPHRPQTG